MYAENFWRGDLDAGRLFSNVHYHIQGPYGVRFPSNENVTIKVLKSLFAETLFDKDLQAEASGRWPQVYGEHKPVSRMKRLLCKIFILETTSSNLCIGHRFIAKACPLAPKYLKNFWFGQKIFVF